MMPMGGRQDSVTDGWWGGWRIRLERQGCERGKDQAVEHGPCHSGRLGTETCTGFNFPRGVKLLAENNKGKGELLSSVFVLAAPCHLPHLTPATSLTSPLSLPSPHPRHLPHPFHLPHTSLISPLPSYQTHFLTLQHPHPSSPTVFSRAFEDIHGI